MEKPKIGEYQQYEMTPEEVGDVQNFLEDIKDYINPDHRAQFIKLINHLCKIQDPYNKKYPFIDNITHGIEVARICMRKDPKLSEYLLLAAIGHDWDRACGERRIKSTDYPNTKEGNKKYKEDHSINSAKLFCAELQGIFDENTIEKVYYLILNHEIGGEGELNTLDFADGMVFFSPKTLYYYRNGRIYVDKNGNKLPPKELEEERKKGFATKVNFMFETFSREDMQFLKDYLQQNRNELNSTVKSELDDLLK